MKTWHVICNPAARRGHAAEIYRTIRGWATGRKDIKLELHMTATAADATNITKELTNTTKDVYIMIIGGDGTINEVVNGIVNFKHTYLLILPFGSGNDFVYTLGLPTKDPVSFMIDYVGKTKVRKVDYFEINGKYRAINSVGLGINSRTLLIRNKMKHFSPTRQYKIASVRASLFWKNFTFWASFDKQPEIKINTMWFCAMNGKRVGARIIATPDAEIDDGLISIMYVESFPRAKTLPLLSKCLKNRVKEVKYAHFITCKEFHLVLNDDYVEYDGNLLEHLNALHVKVADEKVNFIVPDYDSIAKDKK